MARVSTCLDFRRDTEAERLYTALTDGGSIQVPLQDMFWGGCFASFTDRCGTHWMINCAQPAA